MKDIVLNKPLTGLLKKLVELKEINQNTAFEIVNLLKNEKFEPISHLVENLNVSSTIIANFFSTEYNLPFFDILKVNFDNLHIDLIGISLITKHKILPLDLKNKTLQIAMSYPTDYQVVDEIKFQTGLNIDIIIVEYDKLNKILETVISNKNRTISYNEKTNLNESSIINFVNNILHDAIDKGASDVHFEPFENLFRIRLRVDGILFEYSKPSPSIYNKVSTRLKVLANLDIAEKRIPQDGRFRINISNYNYIDFRVSSCPTIFGEKIVVRILDPKSTKLGIDHLGFEQFQKHLLLKALNQPQGMIIVTGPTGSGKTVSLYSALDILNAIEKNILTCEDPIEINIKGITQVQLNLKAGLTFPKILRSFLRQDPDVIMIGEIRDFETADLAIKASQTGHLVLSTLHTNSSSETITRLTNMGILNYNLISSINLIIAQRLARKLCNFCKEEISITKDELIKFGFSHDESFCFNIYKQSKNGCDKCINGYKGRIGIYELLPITKKISRLILNNASSLDIENAAKNEGVWFLKDSGLNLVKKGITSIEEINRVTINYL